MSLKERITDILQEQGHTYDQLAAYIGLTEPDLDFALDHNSLDIRTLELISKALRISLYSFFKNSSGEYAKENAESFYNFNLWSPHENYLKAEIEELKKQVQELRSLLKEKETLIAKLGK